MERPLESFDNEKGHSSLDENGSARSDENKKQSKNWVLDLDKRQTCQEEKLLKNRKKIIAEKDLLSELTSSQDFSIENPPDLPSPTEDLLSWCSSITNEFYGLNVMDLTHSWKNGMAFCAILHHFRPDLIDYYNLNPNDGKKNLKVAFDAASKLGISIARPSDIMILDVPDKLSVITYLHQLRAFFNGKYPRTGSVGSNPSLYDGESDDETSLLGLEWPGSRPSNFRDILSLEDENSFLMGNHGFSHVTDKPTSGVQTKSDSFLGVQEAKCPTANKGEQEVDSKSHSISSKSESGKLILMTRKQLTNPLDSDSEDEELGLKKLNNTQNKSCSKFPLPPLQDSPKDIIDLANTLNEQECELSETLKSFQENHDPSTSTSLASPSSSSSVSSLSTSKSNQFSNPISSENCSSDHSHPIQLAPGLLDLSPRKINPIKKDSSNSSRMMFLNKNKNLIKPNVRERARKLYEEACLERLVTSSSDKEQSDKVSTERREQLRERARNILAAAKINSCEEPAQTEKSSEERPSQLDSKICAKNLSARSSDSYLNHNKRTNQFGFGRFKFKQDELMGPSSEDNANRLGGDNKKSYVESEMVKLEKEQKEIDREGKILETKLRLIMQKGGNRSEEERYLRKWFALVNRRNSLCRRQMKLNILKQEKDLEKCYNILCKDLRALLSIDEWDKTDSQKESEKLLIDQLVQIVDRRDELVRHLDSQEKASEDDDMVITATEEAINLSNTERNCIIT